LPATGKALVQLLRCHTDFGGRALLDGQNLFNLQGTALREARRAGAVQFLGPVCVARPEHAGGEDPGRRSRSGRTAPQTRVGE